GLCFGHGFSGIALLRIWQTRAVFQSTTAILQSFGSENRIRMRRMQQIKADQIRGYPSRYVSSVFYSLESEAVFFQTAVERAAAQAQSLGGAADVAVVTGEGFLDQHALDLFEAQVFDPGRAVRFTAQPEVARPDGLPVRHQHGAFDRVFQLAHVARPGVIPHRLQRGAFKAVEVLAVALGLLAQE